MRLRIVLLAVLGVVVLLAVGVAVTLATLDFGRFTGPIAAQVERATGRALTFNGDVSLRLFPRPSLTVHDAALANAPWGSRPEMLRIGTLAAEVELRPLLFQRVLHVTRLVLQDADLLLETDGQGRHNWDFSTPAPSGNAAPQAAPQAGGEAQGGGAVRTDARALPLADEMTWRNVAVTWRDARSKAQPRQALLKELKLNARPDGRLALMAEAIHREQSVTVAGDLDLPTGFQPPGGPFVANLTVTLPGTVVKLAGGLADARAGHGLDLSLSAEAEPLQSLDELLDATLPEVKAHLSARLQGDLGGTLRVSELALRLGQSDLAGSGSFDLSGPRPKLTADLESTRINLPELLPPPTPAPDTAPAPAPAPTPKAPSAEKRVFGTEAFDLAPLRMLDADITLRAALLETPSLHVEQAMAHAVLADGDLALRPYAFTLAGSRVAGDAHVDARSAPPAAALDVTAQQVDVGRILALAGAPSILEAKGDAVLALRGRGDSPRALAAGLEGNASLVVGQGTLNPGYIDKLGLGVLRTVVPQVQRLADSRLNCAIGRFDIARGVATAKLLAADAGDLSMVGSGTVNLGSETIALDLAPRLKVAGVAGLGGVVVPVQVRGSLLEPAVSVLGGRGQRGNPLAGLGGIVLDPGASRTNPCGGLAEMPAREPAPKPAIPGLPDVLRLLPR